jgi:hypothetical protein
MNERIESMVRDAHNDSRNQSFAPGFSDRAVARWRSSRTSVSLGDVIARDFKRLAPIAIAAAMLLAFYNARASTDSPTIDRLLGLTTVTADAAYDLSVAGPNLQRN